MLVAEISLVTLGIAAALLVGAVIVVIVALNAMLGAECPYCKEERGTQGAPVPLIFKWWCLECGRLFSSSGEMPEDDSEHYVSSWSDEELAELERGEQPKPRSSSSKD